MKKLLAIVLTLGVLLGVVTGCNKNNAQTIKIGASPSPHAEILEFIKPKLEEKGIKLDIQIFTDYVLPNNALQNREIDANFFQHKPYLDDFNEKNKTDIVSVANIHFEPLGIYSDKYKTLDELPEGAKIGIPNDTTNEARALQLLAARGLIKIKNQVGLNATINDITENPKNFKFEELEAALIPRALPDIDIAVINGNYVIPAGISDKVIVTENANSEVAKIFANIIAVKNGNENNENIKTLIEVLQSDDVKAFIKQKYGNTVVSVS